MSVYMTEDEQLEIIKKWWRKYSNRVLIMLSIVFFIIAGIKYWYWHQEKLANQASQAYEQLMVSFSNHDTQGTRAYAQELISNHQQTVYADAARMVLAKLYISEEHYAKAQLALQDVVNYSKLSAFRQMAKLRMARLYMEEKAYDKALSELKTTEDTAYTPAINELKGDIYTAQGDYNHAVIAYREAILGERSRGVGNLFLEMKTNEVAALTNSEQTNEMRTIQSA